MPGESYTQGGLIRGLSDWFNDTNESVRDGMKSAMRFGSEVSRRGSTLPLLRRFSVRSGDGGQGEYEAIPLGRGGAISPV